MEVHPSQILAPSGLSDEHPTDWVKSDLLETISLELEMSIWDPTDWVKSDLLETTSTTRTSAEAEIPTDWVKSDLLETIGNHFHRPRGPTDWVKSDLLETLKPCLTSG